MTPRTARRGAGAYFVLMLGAVTWPGMVPFSRVEPFILGLPFSMAWIAGWLVGAVAVLYGLDRVEKRAGRDDAPETIGRDPRVSPPGGR